MGSDFFLQERWMMSSPISCLIHTHVYVCAYIHQFKRLCNTFFSTFEKIMQKRKKKPTFCFLINQNGLRTWWVVSFLPFCLACTFCKYPSSLHPQNDWLWDWCPDEKPLPFIFMDSLGFLLPIPLCSSELAEDSERWEGWSQQRQSEQPSSLWAPAGLQGQCWQRSQRLVQCTRKCTWIVGTLFQLIHQTGYFGIWLPSCKDATLLIEKTEYLLDFHQAKSPPNKQNKARFRGRYKILSVSGGIPLNTLKQSSSHCLHQQA